MTDEAGKSGSVEPSGDSRGDDRLRVARIATVPMTFETLLSDQVQLLAEHHDLVLIADFDQEWAGQTGAGELVTRSVGLARSLAPLKDLQSLVRMVRILRTERPDVVHSVTPKAGIVSMVAAALARIPRRYHTFTGQVWETASGPNRVLLKMVDRCIAALATDIYCDSASQCEQLENERIVRKGRCQVIGSGSISGVDLQRFSRSSFDQAYRDRIRAELGIPADSLVVLFVGRLARDKGIDDLVKAFVQLPDVETTHLLLAGPMDERDPISENTRALIGKNPNIVEAGFVSDPERIMAASDIFCLPSYREGFGSVVIEAGAMELPVVATNVTGLRDSVVDDVTGLLVEPGDIPALSKALGRLGQDPGLRSDLGRAGRKRAVAEFDAVTVNRMVLDSYPGAVS